MQDQHQEPLWHDTIEDALRSVVDVLGGPKKVGTILWPSLPADDAGRKLSKCLDRARPEKLSHDELLHVLRLGCEAGCHVGMHFICQQAGYEVPRPTNPLTEEEKLQREFIRATTLLDRIADRLAAAQQARARVRAVP